MIITVQVGKPEEDAPFLLSGLSRPNAHSLFPIQRDALAQLANKTSRSADQIFGLIVPGGSVNLTLALLSAGGTNKISAYCDNSHICELELPANTWTDFSVPLPGGTGEASRAVELRLERDPYAYAVQHVFLENITLDIPGDELPGEFAARRIEMDPVYNRTAYFPAHEIRKLGPVQIGRPPGSYKYSREVNTYFGDIHVHTNNSMCGHPLNRSMEENARIAKDRGHDFVAFADHAEHMTPDIWRRYFETMDEIQEKTGILVLPGFEWTSFEYGHRNIYFPDTHPLPPYFHSRTFEANHPDKLKKFFTENNLDAIAAGHHPATIYHRLDPNTITEDTEPVIEIYSTWGNSERRFACMDDFHTTMPGTYVCDLLGRGYHLGFVGGGDVHNTLPGDGGLTAALSPALTRGDIYSAIKNRMCYATSGDRILIDFHINGFPMGTVLKVNQYTIEQLFPIHAAASAITPSPAEKIELVQNGVSIYEKSTREAKCCFDMALDYGRLMSPDRMDASDQIHTANNSRYYYIRVTQKDGGIAWSSPIFIDYKQEYI
ncbi:MAG: CehA/McbA family metallohydrolase [Oscillospiraceae bacterium]|nr:CehA/McbA family metallohydrolase [Oscillospiraceae bacterium]